MTARRIYVTRNGQPAYLNAPPRLRQSDFATARSYSERYRQLREMDAICAEQNGDKPQPGFLAGTLVFAALIALPVIAWVMAP